MNAIGVVLVRSHGRAAAADRGLAVEEQQVQVRLLVPPGAHHSYATTRLCDVQYEVQAGNPDPADLETVLAALVGVIEA